MTVLPISFESHRHAARRAYVTIFHPPEASRGPGPGVVYAEERTPAGWRHLTDPANADPLTTASFAITLSDAAEGRRVFDALADGGAVEAPFAPSAWSPGFGRVRDRWGAEWMVDSLPPPRGGA